MYLPLLSSLSLGYTIIRGCEVENKTGFLTRAEVASFFGVSAHTVTRWAREGKLPHIVTLGGQYRFPQEAIQRIVENGRREVGREPSQRVFSPSTSST
ncbi:MAG: helix-turn-helix domain-containing protein [Chloroflexi bacterium]|nr:helix-turn-helix domain-containing protein [Chloroflexota bacterium]